MLEDEPTTAEILRHYLGGASAGRHEIVLAGTLAEASRHLEAERFDLALVDLHVPDSAGIATLKAARASAPDAVFIVLTADDDPQVRDESLEHGAYEFVHKSRLNQELLHRLVRLASVHARNIRSLRENERRFRSLTALSSDVYWEQDADYRFTTFRSSSAQWRDRGQDRLLGKRRWDEVYFNMSAADWGAHRATLDARRPFYELELGRLNAAGEEVWVSISGEPVFDEAGQFRGYHGVGRDITARKRAEGALKASEERFRSLAALSSDWYWEQDAEFRLTFMSSTLGEKTGLHATAYLGRRRWEQPALNLTEEDWTAHRAQLERHEPFRDFEMERPARNGGSVWLSISGEPVFDREGRFVGYRGVGRDITARKRDERLLRLELSIARSLADAAADDEDAIRAALRKICESEGWKCGRFFRLDEQAQLMRFETGWSVAGVAYEDFLRESRQLGFRRNEGLVGRVWQSVKATWVGDPQSDARIHQRDMWRKAGFLSAFVFPIVARGVAIGAVSISSDAMKEPDQRLLRTAEIIGSQLGHFLQRRQAQAQQREVELRFRQTFEVAGSGIAHVGLDGRLLQVNRKMCEILGHAPAELVGRPLGELSHPDDADVSATLLPGLVAGESASVHVEKRYLRKDGSTVWVDLTMALARDESGRPDYGIVVMEDITERKRSEQLRSLEHAVNRYLASAGEPTDALRKVLQAICESEGWDSGAYFEIDESAAVARFREAWHVEQDAAQRWSEASRRFTYTPGEGLAGRAWQSGSTLWVPDMTHDPRVANVDTAWRTGMRAALNVPVAFEGRTIGVISIASRRIREPDEPLLQALGVIGRQMGQYLLRQRLEHAGRRFRVALDSAADMVFLVDLASTRFLDFNSTASRALGYERHELLGQEAKLVLAGEGIEDHVRSAQHLAREESRADLQFRTYRRKDGSTFDAEVLRRVVESPEGLILVVNARDLTERKAAEQRQQLHVRYQEKIARLGQSALGMREPAALIVDAGQSTLEGLSADAVAYLESAPQPASVVVRDVFGVAQKSGAAIGRYGPAAPLARVLENGAAVVIHNARDPALPFAWAQGARSVCLVPVRARGESATRGALCALSHKPNAFGTQEVRFVEAAASVLSAGLLRIESEGRLAFLAQFDALTGLPNRTLLSDRFSQIIGQAKRQASQLAVLFIDLDDFKLVNDSLGHAAGDELLKEVATRLKAAVRAGDTVARIAGDEFAIVLADLPRPEDAALVAQKIIASLGVAIEVRGQEVFASASIGIAVYPADGKDPETLLGAADAAMYRAKESQRNSYQFFTAEINQRWRARAQLGSELHRALDRDEFRVYYQPKVDLRSGRPSGAEALLRWQHPERGLIPPAEFIPVLEETGLIVAVGEWILRRACEDLNARDRAGLPPLPVAVNLSARQFRHHDLDKRLQSIVRGAGVDPSRIELEITESHLMHDPTHAIRIMRSLRAAGLRMAIDDFGTGYSSLSYLTRFPLAALKIDRSFVRDVLNDQADATIVRTIIDMAKTLGLTVVAEGVETEAQASFLRGLGCEQAQGYFFAQPMPHEALVSFLACS